MAAVAVSLGTIEAPGLAEPPDVPREFRAAWIATVANIDWPSQPGLPVAEQKSELERLLDTAAELRLNAVVLQVRPACDALYDSELEPWSAYLTGEMGQPPEPYYDPLEFAIDGAHSRGLELHAWFNPYRARASAAEGPVDDGHITRTRPDLAREYGQYMWLDPGEADATEHTLSVIMDVVRRYDVDGVHFDDYFYPYPITDDDGEQVDFPDDASWDTYRQSHDGQPPLSRDDWRRANVDGLLTRLYRQIKEAKPWVKFGVSPFGIYRPGVPEGIQGFDAFASIYADSRSWLQRPIVDYFSPQLYWPIDQQPQSFPVLLAWWHEQNAHGRHVWPGLFTSRVGEGSGREWPAGEILRQIEITRDHSSTPGHIHFSIKALAGDRDGLATRLGEQLYAEPALVPASPWLGQPGARPAAPKLRWLGRGADRKLQLDTPDGDPPWLWVVRRSTGGHWTTRIVPGHRHQIDVVPTPPAAAADRHRSGQSPTRVLVSAVNRIGVAGPATPIELPVD